MDLKLFLVVFLLWMNENFVAAIKFSPESLAEIPMLAREGKSHLQSLTEKVNVPQFGPCWKNAISDLQKGCKFLSEHIQSDLALKFTDCFFQMSGHEPLNCGTKKSACLKKLSDRAFNAYTEFYTHTQSICYFLESQVWHEETEKTIDKLSSTSLEVSEKLEEAKKIQKQLFEQQKESLLLQNDLMNNSKFMTKSLQSSQDRINLIMKDFQDSAEKQRKLLNNVFEHLLSFKAFVVDELSWFSSTIFFIVATILSFLFTSVPRTRGARMLLFIVFTVNFLFERYLTSSTSTNIYFLSNLTSSREVLNSWVWLCRNFCSCLSVVILLYFAFTYYNYNFLNYKLLLEIKNQNSEILSHFSSHRYSSPNKSVTDTVTCNNFNSRKWTEIEKPWFQGYENTNSRFFSTKGSFGMSEIDSSSGDIKNISNPTFSTILKQDCGVTAVDGLPATHKDHKIKDDFGEVSSQEKGSVDSFKRSYDLRVKSKVVYAF